MYVVFSIVFTIVVAARLHLFIYAAERASSPGNRCKLSSSRLLTQITAVLDRRGGVNKPGGGGVWLRAPPNRNLEGLYRLEDAAAKY